MDLKELSTALNSCYSQPSDADGGMICKQCFLNRDRQDVSCQNINCMFYRVS